MFRGTAHGIHTRPEESVTDCRHGQHSIPLLVGGATRSVSGVIAQIPPGGTGTYTLEADCRGTLVFTGGPSFDIFASPRGVEFWMIQTNSDNVFQGSVKRVSR